MLDNTAELLLQAGRSLPHVMMMLVPEAWEHAVDLDRPAVPQRVERQRDLEGYRKLIADLELRR